ncbi:MAG: 4-(cytidine 5'-diphospho)-2-C-methyl-D-erythritol kinase [Stellaceae bacterium]
MTRAPARRRWHAPAKLNLYLHLAGRRADGYHDLDGLVAFLDLGDELTVTPAPDPRLGLDGPFAARLDGAPENNLVYRAAIALAARLGIKAGAAITLMKRLPVASGIGGGSGDAAAALRALAVLWGCDDPALLAELARTLGSDVPACLAARPCWLGGVGDLIEPAAMLPRCGVLLVNPLVPLATAAVYRDFQGPFSPPARFAIPEDAEAFASLLAARRNDLTAAATARVPAIAAILARLATLDRCLLARMSGSGATCFALFRDPAEATAAAAALRAEAPGWWVEATVFRAADAALSEPGSCS